LWQYQRLAHDLIRYIPKLVGAAFGEIDQVRNQFRFCHVPGMTKCVMPNFASAQRGVQATPTIMFAPASRAPAPR
jgi:hypothetical protein